MSDTQLTDNFWASDVSENGRMNFARNLERDLARYQNADKMPEEPRILTLANRIIALGGIGFITKNEIELISYINTLATRLARVMVENEILRNAQKACADCETPTVADLKAKLEATQTMYGLARTLCIVNGCKADDFDAAIDAALKESKP